MRPSLKTMFAVTLPLLLVSLLSKPVYAQLTNQKVISLFIHSFPKYIQWPDGSVKAEFIIGVYGKSPIREELEKMGALKKVGDKSIKVVEVSDANLSDNFQILFLPDETSDQISIITNAIKGRPVLIVTERRGLIQKGAGISFFSDQNTLRFELNSNSISSRNLNVSGALEALARK